MEQINHLIFPVHLLTDPRDTVMFWCGLEQLWPLAEKQWWPVDRLEGGKEKFCTQCVPIGCLLWKMTYNEISDHMKKNFTTSNVGMSKMSTEDKRRKYKSEVSAF